MKLSQYILKQINNLIPDGYPVADLIEKYIQQSLLDAIECIRTVKSWRTSSLDEMNSAQYATLLYYLYRNVWVNEGDADVSVRLYNLNKYINNIDIFYEIGLPKHFFLSHTPGIVLAKATYGDYFVIHQGCTVGRSAKGRPVLERGVVMYPNSMIIGNSLVRENTVIAPGVRLVNQDSPGNCYVFEGENGRPRFKELDKFYASRYFDCGY